MWVGAVLTENTDAVRNRELPWGDGGNWSFKELVKMHKGIDIQIVDYIALMHAFTEIANDPSEAICFSE